MRPSGSGNFGERTMQARSRVKTSGRTVVISSAGRRVGLVGCFREAMGSAGRIGAIDSSPFSPAACLADSAWRVPNCRSAEFLPYVLDLCRREAVSLLVPTIDTELAAYASARPRFEAVGTSIYISNPKVVAIAADKVATHEWLVQHGFPTVRQGLPVEVLGAKKSWSLPLIAKPRDGSASIGVQLVRCWAALDVLAETEDHNYIVEEIAPGSEFTINVYVNREGECVCAVPHRRLEVRAGEVSKGVTVKDRRLMSLGQQIAEGLPGARGPLNIQCFMSDSGKVNVIEVNPRFGGGYPLAHNSGARFTHWMIEELDGQRVEHFDAWQDGLAMLRYDEAVYAPMSGFAAETHA